MSINMYDRYFKVLCNLFEDELDKNNRIAIFLLDSWGYMQNLFWKIDME